MKFIHFGQWRIERTGYGILAFITNHGYLDNPTFRGMRQRLTQTFSEISLLDLHGNAKKKETAPDGSKDENVFDIQQGVAIGLYEKGTNATGPAEIRHADLWGQRENKYRTLLESDIKDTKWERLKPQRPAFLFIPQNTDLLKEYEQGHSVTDIFSLNSVGIVSARDNLVVRWSGDEVWETVQDFASLSVDEARNQFHLGADAQDWKVADAQADVRTSGPKRSLVAPIMYRPFDVRFTYYTGKSRGFICRPRAEVMPHMLVGKNIGLSWTRPMSPRYEFSVLVSRAPIDQCAVGNKTAGAGISYLGPLYSYGKDHEGDSKQRRLLLEEPHHGSKHARASNLNPKFIEVLEKRLGLSFLPQGDGDLKKTVGPESLLSYCYAVFHSPSFRKRYAEFLNKDVPRLPLTSDQRLFTGLVMKGQELTALHLLESPKLGTYITRYEQPGDHRVEKVRYVEPNPKAGIKSGRVYINAKQFFEGVPKEVWEFHIGGYQVCEKWLKDRKGRTLSSDDMDHYQKIVVALAETIRIMKEIDEIIPGWPLP